MVCYKALFDIQGELVFSLDMSCADTVCDLSKGLSRALLYMAGLVLCRPAVAEIPEVHQSRKINQLLCKIS